MGHLSRRLARAVTSLRGRHKSRESAVVRAHSSKNRATIQRLFAGPDGEGSGSLDSRPFLPLTGYALGLSRHLTWVTVSDLEEELRRLTIDSAGRLTEEFESIRRGAREYLAGAPEGPDAPMVD